MTKDIYRIVMYIIMGGFTTAVNIVSYWLADAVFGLDYRIATTIAWIAAVLFAYVVNKKYVFESKTPTWRDTFAEMGSFFGFRFLSFLMDLLAMIVLVSGLQMNGTIAKALANIVVLVANYIFSKRYIFKDRERKPKASH